jgi:HPt (histidine-containing phosphotransfer) domain-containing protein
VHEGSELAVPEIEGIDVASGLERLAGNKRLYRDLLNQFVAKQESVGKRIAQALKQGDRNQAERLAHSLKGVAGNLGIIAIFHSAGNLEKAIRESQTGLEGLVKDLASAMDRQIGAIRTAGSVDGTGGTNRPVTPFRDSVQASMALGRLKGLLEASDADACEAYRDLADLLKDMVDSSRLEQLGTAVKSFDFEAALDKLNEVAKEFGEKERLPE